MAIKGMKKEDYKAAQEKINEDNFNNNANYRINDLVYSLNSALERINSLEAKQGELKMDNHLEITKVMNDCTDSLKGFKSIIDDLQIKMNSLINNMACMEGDLRGFALSQDVSKLIADLELKINSLSAGYNNSLNDLRNEMGRHNSCCQALHQKFKDDILSIPSEIPELKILFDKKLELVELNGQNSVLRSTNNERHINLLEKKIENLYQLLKKFDLDNQG